MNTEKVSAPYARALMELAQEEGKLDKLGKEMIFLKEVFRLYPDLTLFLASPSISQDKKLGVIRKVVGRYLSPILLDFMALVLDHGRGALFPEMVDLFRNEADRRAGRARAKVTTAVGLDRSSARRIRRVLEKKLNMTIVVDEKVDPSILGGLWVRVGDSVLDGTLKSRLKALRKRMDAGKLKGEVAYED